MIRPVIVFYIVGRSVHHVHPRFQRCIVTDQCESRAARSHGGFDGRRTHAALRFKDYFFTAISDILIATWDSGARLRGTRLEITFAATTPRTSQPVQSPKDGSPFTEPHRPFTQLRNSKKRQSALDCGFRKESAQKRPAGFSWGLSGVTHQQGSLTKLI